MPRYELTVTVTVEGKDALDAVTMNPKIDLDTQEIIALSIEPVQED